MSGLSLPYDLPDAMNDKMKSLRVMELRTYPNPHDGEELWDRIIAKNDEVELLITNPRLHRVALGDRLEVSIRVIPSES